LRQLRNLLRDPSKERHFSQKKLALLCAIPVDTIKSIEVGRLALTPAVLRNIAVATGASWNHEEARWTKFDKTAFTFSDFSEYRFSKLSRSALDKAYGEVAVALIHSKVDWLFKNVPVESWDILKSRLSYSLEECKRDLRLTANDALFYRPKRLETGNGPAATLLAKPLNQPFHRPPKRVGELGNIAGNKKRKRRYG
jgi:hypothetical protein